MLWRPIRSQTKVVKSLNFVLDIWRNLSDEEESMSRSMVVAPAVTEITDDVLIVM